jgi:hypothetical protein
MEGVFHWLLQVERHVGERALSVAERHKLPLVSTCELSLLPDDELHYANEEDIRWPSGLVCKFVRDTGKSFKGNVDYSLDEKQVILNDSMFERTSDPYGRGHFTMSVECAISCALHYFILPHERDSIGMGFLQLPQRTKDDRPNALVKTTVNNGSFVQLRTESVRPIAFMKLELPLLTMDSKVVSTITEQQWKWIDYLNNGHWSHLGVFRQPISFKLNGQANRSCSLENIGRVACWPFLPHLRLTELPDTLELNALRDVTRNLAAGYEELLQKKNLTYPPRPSFFECHLCIRRVDLPNYQAQRSFF